MLFFNAVELLQFLIFVVERVALQNLWAFYLETYLKADFYGWEVEILRHAFVLLILWMDSRSDPAKCFLFDENKHGTWNNVLYSTVQFAVFSLQVGRRIQQIESIAHA